MSKGQGKSGLIITIIVLGLTLVIVSTIVILQSANRPAATEATSSIDTTKDTTETDSTKSEDTTTEETTASETTTPTVDAATLTSVDIEPLKIVVFYTKGTPGFDFAVKRTADRTQYVEFSSPDLVGTKCTNDEGVIGSIIKNPASTEDQATLTATQKVGGDTYGLSLAGSNCTSDTELLTEYQTAFKNGFNQLKVME